MRFSQVGLVACLVVVGFVVTPQETVCEATAAQVAATPVPAPPRTTEPPPPPVDLAGALASAALTAGERMDLGVSLLDLRTGQLVSGRGGAQAFYAASLSKLILAVDMLEGPVSDVDRARLQRALSVSDDSAMDALWTVRDGMGAIGRVAARLGLQATAAPRDPSQWGEVLVSPDDVVRLYQYILTTMVAESRDFIVGALDAAPRVAADGFDQSFGLLGADRAAYAKQGWMYYLPADLYLHSAGVVNERYVVALLSVQTGVSTAAARSHLAAITSALLAPLPAA